MLERVTQLCDAAFGIANTYDGERFRTAALRRQRTFVGRREPTGLADSRHLAALR